MADCYLTNGNNYISNIEFTLGTLDTGILLETQKSIGKNDISVYSETRFGILLQGSMERWLSNLQDIPDVSRVLVCSYAGLSSSGSGLGERHPPVVEACIESDPGVSLNCRVSILNDQGNLDENELNKAAKDMLDMDCDEVLKYDQQIYNEDSVEVNDKVINYVLDNSERTPDGRIRMPLPWRDSAAPYLGNNYNLAKQILQSNLKKLGKDDEKLQMVDEVFKEQERLGIIERIDNIDLFLQEHPEHSFLGHMSIFKMDKATSKCRVVFLSNLSGKGKGGSPSLSHNQTLYAGPCLNQKLSTAILHSRFGTNLLCYDLRKAFLQVALRETDSNKLMFLWHNNVAKKDFSLVAYRNLRLSFGLPCSPTLLMLSLYQILVLDAENDEQMLQDLKRSMYSLIYMDNGAICGTDEEINFAYKNLESIFEPYGFEVQQLQTNNTLLQTHIDGETETETCNTVKLLGLQWDRGNDSFSASPINLDSKAKTKREILKSIASQYDIFNIHGPCLNRARIFLHKLQCEKTLSWDTKLDPSRLSEWSNISKQANNTPAIQISRNFGNRNDPYELIAFTDASKSIYAAVVYIKNVSTGKVSFVGAKNRLVNRQMQTKTIPTLELQGVTLGVEYLLDIREELSGSKCLYPIDIKCLKLYTDSTITLNWLTSYTYKFDKMSNQTVFNMNRLSYIARKCEKFPIQFNYVGTNVNPADCMSRPLSYNQLSRSCYIAGPEFLTSAETSNPVSDEYLITIPNPNLSPLNINVGSTEVHVASVISNSSVGVSPPPEKFSSLKKLINSVGYVHKFVNVLKKRLKDKSSFKYSHFELLPEDANYYELGIKSIIRIDQLKYFPVEVAYLKSLRSSKKDLPPLISRLNVFLDPDGLMRVKSKFDRWSNDPNFCLPYLISNESPLTKLIVLDTHKKMSHAGCYNVLSTLRQQFWIDKVFSTVKNILKKCVLCKRFNSRTVKLNQNAYRDYRANPVCIPYRFIFIDYLGPFSIRHNDVKQKVYLLCITCLWSRGVSLKICPDLSVKSFLRAFQMHVFEQGLPSKIFSDLGSNFTSGFNIMSDFLSNVDTVAYLNENGIRAVTFEQYFKGNSALGSLVEVCVKFTKRLMFGSVRNNVLQYPDFEFLVSQTIHLLNKRPIAFKEALRDNSSNDLPSPITPEILTKGRDLFAINVIPQLHHDGLPPEWTPNSVGAKDVLREQFSKLKRVQQNLIDTYNSEFTNILVNQATDNSNRYSPVPHTKLRVNDIVLLKEENTKVNNYPMAIVTKVVENSRNEVTDVILRKGNSRENIKRHVTSVIPLFRENEGAAVEVESSGTLEPMIPSGRKSDRAAAKKSKQRTAQMFSSGEA